MKKTKTTEAPAAVTPGTPSPFRDARRASVPIIQFETSDPQATINACLTSMNGSAATTPCLQWDLGRLLQPVNEAGAAVITELSKSNPDPSTISNPAEFLNYLTKPEALKELAGTDKRPAAILFVHNMQRMLPEPSIIQGVWNLRDLFKGQATTLVMLTTLGAPIPPELVNDVITLTDPKPGPKEASAIIKRMAEAAQANGAEIDPETVSNDNRVISRTLGPSGFGLEQVVAMSIRKTGLDNQTLMNRQRKMIEQTKGLSVMDTPERIDDIAGNAEVIAKLRRVLTSGRTPVNGILFMDEVDKSALGAGQGDTSGTSQDQVGVLLKLTADHNIPILMLFGPGGTGKSMIAKAAASISGTIGMAADLGACKGSLVGQSEQMIRELFDTAGAVTQWKMVIIMTCNRMAAITPEMRRRIKMGTYFVDFLSEEERAVCWKLKRAKFQIPESEPTPAGCEGWTGAEIESACESAYRENITLEQAARMVVPICISAREEIEALRKGAANKFLSASKPGLYQYREIKQTTTTDTRALKFD